MRTLWIAVSLTGSSLAWATPVIDAAGTCPGPALIDVTDLTPEGPVQIFMSRLGTGDDHVAAGPCADTVTGLRGILVGPAARANGLGQLRLTPTLSGGLCGVTMQLMDVATCTLSELLRLDDLTVPGVGVPVSFTHCGATGQYGPDQPACDAAYAGTELEGAVTVVGGVQAWTVPRTGRYSITAVGAAGVSGDGSYLGGRGAEISGVFELMAGEVLDIVVGQQGNTDGCDGSGGGGSFVIVDGRPLLVAGGGGGTRTDVVQDGCDALVGEFGGTGSNSLESWDCGPKGSGLALGGIVSSGSWGSAGAGFDGSGAIDSPYATMSAEGWPAFSGGAGPDTMGGFGGGGAGDGSCGGGGGGGYSGGDGGRLAGGGGSYNSGLEPTALAGVGLEHGLVSIAPD
jgi:hypothetical protein